MTGTRPRSSSLVGAGLAAALSLAAWLQGCRAQAGDAPVDGAAGFDLLERLPQAEVISRRPDDVRRIRMSIGGEEREALLARPPSRIVFPPFEVGLGSQLKIDLGVAEAAWEEAGDGVEFVVSAIPAGGDEKRLVSIYLDPKHQDRDRHWRDTTVTLGQFAGQKVSLVFETNGGPVGDVEWDLGAWNRARVLMNPDAR